MLFRKYVSDLNEGRETRNTSKTENENIAIGDENVARENAEEMRGNFHDSQKLVGSPTLTFYIVLSKRIVHEERRYHDISHILY